LVVLLSLGEKGNSVGAREEKRTVASVSRRIEICRWGGVCGFGEPTRAVSEKTIGADAPFVEKRSQPARSVSSEGGSSLRAHLLTEMPISGKSSVKSARSKSPRTGEIGYGVSSFRRLVYTLRTRNHVLGKKKD